MNTTFQFENLENLAPNDNSTFNVRTPENNLQERHNSTFRVEKSRTKFHSTKTININVNNNLPGFSALQTIQSGKVMKI